MLSAGRELQLGQTHRGGRAAPWTGAFISGDEGWLLLVSLWVLIFLPLGTAWPYDYRHLYHHCPGPEWNVMCRGCCEYDVIRCKCPIQGTEVGYAVPCCRNAINECDPCIIHPGCSIFENCRRCNNGTWGPRDDFFTRGKYCAECRPGWSGGDCMKCGGVIRKRQGHLGLESYPNNARCDWTIQVDEPFTIEFRFMMLSLEYHPSCRYDYVEIRDGDSIHSRVIGRFCGNSRPAILHSSSNSLHIHFVSDGYKNFDGFFATFQESSACSSSPCLHDGTCILDTSYTYHCACLAGYTGKRCENVVGCRRPPVPNHGSTDGSFHHSGARITFRCDPGFELRGFRSAICLSDGSWSAPAPLCVPVEKVCALPPKPTHGDHFLVYGPNDVLIALQYMCYRPFELSGISQRTCLPNNTWSGTPPVCIQVNNTLTQGEKDKPKSNNNEEIGKDIWNTTKEKDISPSTSQTPALEGDGSKTTLGPRRTADEDEDNEQYYIIHEGTEKPTEGGRKKLEQEPDNNLNPNEERQPEAPEILDTKVNITDPHTKLEKDITNTVVVKDKGQAEKERKEEQVNGKRNPDKIGPNDTKLRTVISEGENTVEIFELEMTKNNTDMPGSGGAGKENSIGVSTTGRKIMSSRANVTQFTRYRAGEETYALNPQRKNDLSKEEHEDRARKWEKEQEEEEAVKEDNQSFTENSCPPLPRLYNGYHQVVPGAEPETVEFMCNHSYALNGPTRRSCQPNGTWSGRQPICVRACREPKVSDLVRQRVLSPQVPSRKTPVHKLFTASLGQARWSEAPTGAPQAFPQLPPGFHYLYTHIEYECASQYYHHSGSSRRTCLKTGKWSGRHVSCSPVCGKHPTFDPERPEEAHWPWLAAIYRRPTKDIETKMTKADSQAETQYKADTGRNGHPNQTPDWQLVCSAALVNQRTLVVAAHCVTELGKLYPVDIDTIGVVVGKHFRDDHRKQKGLQWLRVASIAVHPNYDPNILDSDIAVIKLSDKARIGEKVLPLCLSKGEDDEVSAGQGLVTGWSPLPDPSLGPDERARVGLVHLTDIIPCEQQYARNGVPVSVTDNMLCASQKPNYRLSNICPSDTGGILVLSESSESHKSKPVERDSKGLWRLLGLVSFGYDKGDCDPDLYTVYTRVANFKDWIESNMK